MQDRQLAAIDLAMKVLAWEVEQGQVSIAHNSLAWLKQRHGLTDEATLRTIDEALAKVRAGAQEDACTCTVQLAPRMDVARGPSTQRTWTACCGFLLRKQAVWALARYPRDSSTLRPTISGQVALLVARNNNHGSIKHRRTAG